MVVAKVYPRIPKGGTKHFLQHHSGSPGSTSTTVRHVRTPSGGIKHFLQHRSGLSESAAVPYLSTQGRIKHFLQHHSGSPGSTTVTRLHTQGRDRALPTAPPWEPRHGAEGCKAHGTGPGPAQARGRLGPAWARLRPGGDGRTDGHTDGRNCSPFYRTFSPTRADALLYIHINYRIHKQG